MTGVDGQLLPGSSRLLVYANFVKVAHTVFALPFTVVGIALASFTHAVTWRHVALAVLAFAGARFAAMGFNRIADARYDALNPRTAMRELPAGRMTKTEAWVLVVIASLVFVGAAAALNPLCLMLAPVALAWVLGYSLTKRFSHWTQLWLGVGLAIAPVGGYLAVTGQWARPWWLLLLLAGAVASWVSGFDTLYALQDEDFDRSNGLKSIPVLLGARRSIWLARTLHVVAILMLGAFGAASPFGLGFAVAVAVASLVLLLEHRLVRAGDYSRLDAAFFTMNGIISAVVMAGALTDAVLR